MYYNRHNLLEPNKMERKLMLSSPKAQPFGLLSSKAVVDFTVGSRAVPNPKYSFRHGAWKTVTQYVYVNMFKKDKHRQRMSEMLLSPEPFTNMLALRDQEDSEIYNEASLRGLRERFRQREELRTRLYQTRGRQLVHDNKEVLTMLNYLRLQKNQGVYDPKANREVPRTEVLKVISGVEDQLSKDPSSIPDDVDFEGLRKYAKRVGRDLPLNDEIFLNINYIVPIIKYRLGERLWNQEAERFKDHLLDVVLDLTLEEAYPHLDLSEYAEAKRQQIAKEKRLDVYKDQLYNIYVKGMKGMDQILDRLRFTPDETLREMGRSAREIDSNLLAPEEQAEKIYIQPDDPFLPQYIEDVVIDGRRYASAVHFAYARLVANLIDIGELPGLETFDVNTLDLRGIVETYDIIKRDWIDHNLKANNEAAIGMKFEQHPTLAHLLLATGDSEIVWNDRSDPVLGVFEANAGANNTGRLLEFVRDSYRNVVLPNTLISSYGSIANNLWTNSWMMSMAQDFKNTMLLLRNPSTADLEVIYGVQGVPAQPSGDNIQSLHMAGLNNDQIAIAFPLIVAMYIPMRVQFEAELMNDQAMAYFAENDYSGRKRELNSDLERATNRLRRASELVQLAPGVDIQKFVMSILGNKQTSNTADARWARIYNWSH
jgi:predicted NAD-dependent protein-ADP-ribosyltransferase YbiA (DUF1768 family)